MHSIAVAILEFRMQNDDTKTVTYAGAQPHPSKVQALGKGWGRYIIAM